MTKVNQRIFVKEAGFLNEIVRGKFTRKFILFKASFESPFKVRLLAESSSLAYQ